MLRGTAVAFIIVASAVTLAAPLDAQQPTLSRPKSLVALPDTLHPVPSLRPIISHVVPTDPDGQPVAELGTLVTATGERFGYDKNVVYVVIGPYPQTNASALTGPSDSYFEAHPQTVTLSMLRFIVPATLPSVQPGVSRDFYLWVYTLQGGWSDPVKVSFFARAAAPHITSVVPQVPGLRTLVSGTGFKAGGLVYMHPPMDRYLQTRYVGPSTLEITLPEAIAPGVYSISVTGSNEYRMHVLMPPPMNLFARDSDVNALPLNPKWGWQLLRDQANPDYFLNPGSYLQSASSLPLPESVVTDDLDTDNAFLCKARHGPKYFDLGHLNWVGSAVTFESAQIFHFTGVATWDNDYDFYMKTPMGAAGTVFNDHAIELEFASGELPFDQGWWKLFATSLLGNVSQVANLVRDRQAIVTGLFGLDCAHECHPEVHPVYALAIDLGRIGSSAPINSDTWALMVRNWGNEGWCSNADWQWPVEQYTIRIPWKQGTTSVSIASTDLWTQKNAPVSTGSYVADQDGVYITFNLPTPDRHPLAFGTVSLQWSGAVTLTPLNGADLSRAADGGAGGEQRDSVGESESMERLFEKWLRTVDPAKARAFRAAVARRRVKAMPKSRRITPVRLDAKPTRVASPRTAAPRIVASPDSLAAADDRERLDALFRSGLITAADRARILRSGPRLKLPLRASPRRPE